MRKNVCVCVCELLPSQDADHTQAHRQAEVQVQQLSRCYVKCEKVIISGCDDVDACDGMRRRGVLYCLSRT